MAERKQTKLDKDVTTPATTQPGDAPADTTDPDERASSVPPRPGEEALRAGTVNAVVPIPQEKRAERDSKNDRTETYEAVRPDGSKVKVKRNVETGETSVS